MLLHRFRANAAVAFRLFALCAAFAYFASAQSSSTDFGALAVNAASPVSKTINFTFAGLSAAPHFSLKWQIDFAHAGWTCTAGWTTCTVTVNFTPKYPGLRQDAVRVTDDAGKLLATAYMHGTGVGPLLAFSPGVISLPQVGPAVSSFGGSAMDASGAFYVINGFSRTLQKLEVGTNTLVTLLFPPDAQGSVTTPFASPRDIAINAAGDLVVLDGDRIRKVDAISRMITDIAGGGIDSGDNVPATRARLSDPQAIAVDMAGNVYVLEAARHSVRKVDMATGMISTVAGNGTSVNSGDGIPAVSAGLYSPLGIAVTGLGDVYIAQGDNRIRKVDAGTGIIETVAGTGQPGYSGDGGLAALAQLRASSAIAVDALGYLYIADLNGVIRRVDGNTHIITTVAGNPSGLAVVDGYSADRVRFSSPLALAVDSLGNLYLNSSDRITEIVAGEASLLFAWPGTFGVPPVKTIALANIGNQQLSFDSQSVSGPFALQLSGQGQCNIPGRLDAGSTCTVSFAYAREQGTGPGVFSVTSNTLNQAETVEQAKLQVGYPGVELSTSSLDLSAAAVGASDALSSFTVKNSGTVPLTFQSIQVTGTNASDFQVGADNCEAGVLPGANCYVVVSFRPRSVGLRSATVMITDNAAVSPQTVTLTGTGLAPAKLTVNLTQLPFGPQQIGTTSAPQFVTLTNTGEALLWIGPVFQEPYGETEFSYQFSGNAALPIYLKGGESIQLAVSFSPKAAGARNGALSFRVNSAYLPEGRITLTGTGTSWKAPGKLDQLSVAPDGTVWGINSAGGIYTFSASAQDWTPVPGYLSQISAAPDGVAWGLNNAGYIYRWNPSLSQWDWIPGNLSQISVGADGDVWGINSGHSVYHFDNATQDWQQVPGTLSTISVGFDGAVWGLGLHGEIFRLRPGARVFEQIPGWLSQISVGADGEVWGINSASAIYHFDSLTRVWNRIPGSLQQIAVGADGDVWGINSSGIVYRYQGATEMWNEVPGQLSKIAVGATGIVWGLDASGAIFQLSARPYAGPWFLYGWFPVSQVSVGPDGNAWDLSPSGEVSHFNALTQSWTRVPGILSEIVAGDGGTVWGLNSSGAIYRFDAARQDWVNIPGQLSHIYVGASGHVWGLNSAGFIYRFNPETEDWDNIPGNLAQLAVGADDTLWGINAAGDIYRLTRQTNTWEKLPGSLIQIAVASNDEVWGLNSAGSIYRFNPQKQDWDVTPGRFSQVAAAFDGSAWAVSPSHEAWKYNFRSAQWDSFPGVLTRIVPGADAVVWGINDATVLRLR